MIALAVLNALPQAEFTRALGEVFEHSPWVAERAAHYRPFASRLQLLEAMRTAVAEAGLDAQLSLIRAHPPLRARPIGALTASSASEQRAAGLPGCSAGDSEELERLNAAYSARFGFPFVLAVRGHTPASILAALAARLANDEAQERDICLREIGRIAAYRLADRIESRIAAEVIAMLEMLPDDAAVPPGRSSPSATAARATSMVRDWMLSADMSVQVDTHGQIVGRAGLGRPHTATLIAGVYYDTETRAPARAGRMEYLTVIAVLQQLKQQRISLPCDVAVIARPERIPDASRENAFAVDESAPCLASRDLGSAGADSDAGDALLALRCAGVPEGSLVTVRRQDALCEWRNGATPDAAMIERASSLWRRRLLGLDRPPGEKRKVSIHE
ncbi:MAG: 2-oxo-4-hydroxy-4-carboxy-5-ureidoimidazoline decarboxylase [Gammaproteobacteria bacterium]|nr:2-oxo-4-hydroxy-4-carboxy-5-ureidoimidazoline decarboxylase [Gammaproteobacteria bacterium]